MNSPLPPYTLLGLVALNLTGCATQPSFDCAQPLGSVAALICRQPDLSALDAELAGVYHSARERAPAAQQAQLTTSQQDWRTERDECWQSEREYNCIADSYRYRIAALQALYGLRHTSGPFVYRCDQTEGDRVTITYYATEPASAVATRADQTHVLFMQPSTTGARYSGDNVSLWIQGEEAVIRWGYEGYGNPEMRCRIEPLSGNY
ncbi:MAG TPA: MliC family protein [Motiliproteus sp.]